MSEFFPNMILKSIPIYFYTIQNISFYFESVIYFIFGQFEIFKEKFYFFPIKRGAFSVFFQRSSSWNIWNLSNFAFCHICAFFNLLKSKSLKLSNNMQDLKKIIKLGIIYFSGKGNKNGIIYDIK